MSKVLSVIVIAFIFLIATSTAFAHVVVQPKQVNSAAFQTFTVGVPVEKETATTNLRLVIPKGLKHVTPNVKPGWKIETKKSGEGEDAVVTEIIWSGGSIPSGQRDDFLFSAQVPADELTLQWKAYQTYENGEVVAWDQAPGNSHDHASNPYSETKVVNDLNSASTDSHTVQDAKKDSLPIILSVAALIMSAGALFLQSRKNKK